LNGLTITNT